LLLRERGEKGQICGCGQAESTGKAKNHDVCHRTELGRHGACQTGIVFESQIPRLGEQTRLRRDRASQAVVAFETESVSAVSAVSAPCSLNMGTVNEPLCVLPTSAKPVKARCYSAVSRPSSVGMHAACEACEACNACDACSKRKLVRCLSLADFGGIKPVVPKPKATSWVSLPSSVGMEHLMPPVSSSVRVPNG